MKKQSNSIVFVSPHFDDAVFSAGGFMTELAKNGNKIIVVNVFTSCGDAKNSFSAKQYLRKCNYISAHELYKQRTVEDAAVLSMLGVKSINLGLVDALWRKKAAPKLKGIAEIELLYPTYRIHVSRGKIHKDDASVQVVTSELKKIIARNKVNMVVGPRGIGNHVDHIVTREAILNTGFKNILFWDDYPYNISTNEKRTADIRIKPKWSEKRELMKCYKTQYEALFPHGLIERDEIFSK